MYSTAIRQRAVALHQSGFTLKEVSSATGASIGTIARWARQSAPKARVRHSCPVSGGALQPGVPHHEYAYLLGLYLGDGHPSTSGRRPELRIYCGDMWPGPIDRCAEAMSVVLPSKPVKRYQRQGCTCVQSTSKHWLCLFTNKSTDIIRILTGALDAVGVQWTAATSPSGAVNVSIARKNSVALMDTYIGPKY